jgi:hypothetical protein
MYFNKVFDIDNYDSEPWLLKANRMPCFEDGKHYQKD